MAKSRKIVEAAKRIARQFQLRTMELYINIAKVKVFKLDQKTMRASLKYRRSIFCLETQRKFGLTNMKFLPQ